MRREGPRLIVAGGFLLACILGVIGYFDVAPVSSGNSSASPAAPAAKASLAPPFSSSQDQVGHGAEAQTAASLGEAESTSLDEDLRQALQISDPIARQKRLHELLSKWAESDPEAAFQWARTSPENVNEAAIAAVFDGVALRPALAIILGKQLLANDWSNDRSHGLMLVGALTRNGQFDAALQLANDAPADLQADWLSTIFTGWAQTNPTGALQALSGLTNPAMHESAFNALVDSWSSSMASDLAAFSISLPPGPDRNRALQVAMDKWSLQDPAALSEWINNLPSSDDLDQGIAWIVTRTDGANRTPDVAITWAESINNPALRLSSVTQVVHEWAASNPAAARQYVMTASWLTADERTNLLQASSPTP